MEKGIVKIGNKDKSAYLKAVLFSLDKNDRAILKALGGRQNKLIDLLSELKEFDDVIIEKKSSIYVKETPGLEAIVKKEVDE